MPISLERASLVSIFVESILYGLFLSLFAISFVILIKTRKRVKLNTSMIAVSLAMLIFGTIHVGSDLQRVFNGFLNSNRPAHIYLINVNDPLYMVKSASYSAQTILGDGFLLFRVYLVWKRSRLVVFPLFLCLLASTAVGIGTLYAFTFVTPSTPVFIVSLQHWIIAFFTLTLITNAACTCLIAGRIWWVHRKTRGRIGGPNLAAPMILVTESGAIYSLCLIILLILYVTGSFAQYVALDAVTQVIGIVFSLVIVRIGLGLSTDGARSGSNQVPMRLFNNSDLRNPSTWPWLPSVMQQRTVANEFMMQPLEVGLTTVRKYDQLEGYAEDHKTGRKVEV